MTSTEPDDTSAGGPGAGGPGHATPPKRNPRDAQRWLYVALAVVVAAAVAATAAAVRARFGPPALAGAVMNPPVTAYEFSLPDQDGRVVSLAALRGKVVVLTFLYTHCPDVCPLIADAFHAAFAQLDSGTAARTAFMAVSVDPNGDTPEAIKGFLAGHHVQGEMSYLHGSFAQLRPVWAHYYVGSDAKEVNPEAANATAPTVAQVEHTAIVYLIDPAGKIKVFLAGNLDPKDLVADIRALAGR
ncbi:MAG TPA: SCO family protein [bacterium]|nr:SCO family protein [bacterium]